MKDTADKWYKFNFGKQKPYEDNNDIFNNESSRILSVVYEKSFEYLNDITFMDSHI